jgi:hypothetical protein
MIRSSSRSRLSHAVVFLALTGACSTRDAAGPGFATAAELPDGPRRPDGVVVDPIPEFPAAVDDTAAKSPTEPLGNARRSGEVAALVALKPPLPDKLARTVVAAFFRAVVTEDIDALGGLVTSDATTPVKARGGAQGIADLWRSRLRQFRYRTLAGDVLYQEADIELYRYDDLETLLPGRPFRPPEMARTDLLLRVPLLVVRAGNNRVFGDEMLFLLRRDKGRYRIRQLIEDFQLP